MKENYWIHHRLNPKEITPFYGFYQDKIKVLNENEFNFKMNMIKGLGIRGIVTGAMLIGMTYFAQKTIEDAKDYKSFFTLNYIVGSLGAAMGGKRTYDYFKHRNDPRPASEEEAFYKYIVNEKDEKQ